MSEELVCCHRLGLAQFAVWRGSAARTTLGNCPYDWGSCCGVNTFPSCSSSCSSSGTGSSHFCESPGGRGDKQRKDAVVMHRHEAEGASAQMRAEAAAAKTPHKQQRQKQRQQKEPERAGLRTPQLAVSASTPAPTAASLASVPARLSSPRRTRLSVSRSRVYSSSMWRSSRRTTVSCLSPSRQPTAHSDCD